MIFPSSSDKTDNAKKRAAELVAFFDSLPELPNQVQLSSCERIIDVKKFIQSQRDILLTGPVLSAPWIVAGERLAKFKKWCDENICKINGK